MIHVAGDSHVCFFNGIDSVHGQFTSNDGQFTTYFLSGPLAYNLGKLNSTQGQRDHVSKVVQRAPASDDILVSMGEIDCRYHIPRNAARNGVSIEEGVRICVGRYVQAILEINNGKHRVGVWAPIATTWEDVVEAAKTRVIWGNIPERNNITRLFGKELQRKCAECGVYFYSILDKLVDENGNTRSEYYMDFIHLSQKAAPFITGFFKDGKFA